MKKILPLLTVAIMILLQYTCPFSCALADEPVTASPAGQSAANEEMLYDAADAPDESKKEADSELARLKALAIKGDTAAMNKIGWHYYQQKQYAGAALWWYEASMLQDAESTMMIGLLFATGEGVEKDLEEAQKWFLKASELGSVHAIYNLGVIYENEGNVQKAFDTWLSAAEKGDLDAMYWLGNLYYAGNGTEQNTQLAFEWWNKAAEDDHEDSIRTLANLYTNGDEKTQANLEEAIRWRKKLANKGDADAMLALLWEYYDGDCGYISFEDLLSTVQSFSKAADPDEIINMLKESILFALDPGAGDNDQPQMPYNPKFASMGKELFKALISLNDPHIQFKAAEMLYDSFFSDDPEDNAYFQQIFAMAAELWTKAADAEEYAAQSMKRLEALFCTDAELDIDYQPVVALYLPLAEQGDANAMYWMGHFFENGMGVEKSLEAAREWYKKAADAGNPDAASRLAGTFEAVEQP